MSDEDKAGKLRGKLEADRAARLATELRANLKKRKALARKLRSSDRAPAAPAKDEPPPD